MGQVKSQVIWSDVTSQVKSQVIWSKQSQVTSLWFVAELFQVQESSQVDLERHY